MNGSQVGLDEERLTDLLRILPRQESFELAADPIIKWAGGKRSLRRDLYDLVPPAFTRYFEPFLGGATFFLSLASVRPDICAVLGDANCELMQLYQAVRNDVNAVMARLDALQYHVLDEQFYYGIRAKLPESLTPSERAARFIYLNKTCYNGLYRVNRHGHFNVPFGRYSKQMSLYNRANMKTVAKMLRQAELRCGDFAEALRGAEPGDFIYLDPPYVPLTPTASFTRYTKGAFGDDDQERLAQTVHTLTERGCKILLSNSETPRVRDLYKDEIYRKKVVYAPRNINSKANGRSKIAELAIYNYPVD